MSNVFTKQFRLYKTTYTGNQNPSVLLASSAVFETIVIFNYQIEKRIDGANLTQITTKGLTEGFSDFLICNLVDSKEDIEKFVNDHEKMALQRLNGPELTPNEKALMQLGFTRQS